MKRTRITAQLLIITSLALTLLVVGCATVPSWKYPTPADVRSAFRGQRCVASEPGFENPEPWLKRDAEIRYELGRWLPDDRPSLLVTVDVIETCHAEGFVHHIIAVLDPQSHKLLTPVFHLVADHAQRRIIPGPEQDVVVYDAHKDKSFTDVSYVLRFRPDGLDAARAIRDHDPERFDFVLSRSSRSKSVLQEFEWKDAANGGPRYRSVTKTIPLIWSQEHLTYVEQKSE